MGDTEQVDKRPAGQARVECNECNKRGRDKATRECRYVGYVGWEE